MILVDANILIYAANHTAQDHRVAQAWLDDRLTGSTRVGLPWPSLLAFVRITTNPAFVQQAVPPAKAWSQVRAWLGCDTAWIPQPGDRHADILGDLLAGSFMTSRLVPDAHLAALAIEHGLTLCSADGDFARFPGLKWENPLAAA